MRQGTLALNKHPDEILQLRQAESNDINVRFSWLLCSPSLDSDIVNPEAAVPSSVSEK